MQSTATLPRLKWLLKMNECCNMSNYGTLMPYFNSKESVDSYDGDDKDPLMYIKMQIAGTHYSPTTSMPILLCIMLLRKGNTWNKPSVSTTE